MPEDLVAAVCIYWLLRGQLGRVARLVALLDAAGALHPAARAQALIGLVDRLKALLGEMGRQPAVPAGAEARQIEILNRLILALEGNCRDLMRLELELKALAASGAVRDGSSAVRQSVETVLEGLPQARVRARALLAKLESKQQRLLRARLWRLR